MRAGKLGLKSAILRVFWRIMHFVHGRWAVVCGALSISFQ